MAKKVKEVAKAADKVKEVAKVESKPIDKLDDKGVFVVVGEEKGSLKTGKEFTVSGNVANALISKGIAKLKN